LIGARYAVSIEPLNQKKTPIRQTAGTMPNGRKNPIKRAWML